MSKKLLIPVIALGAVLLIVTGALAGALLARDHNDKSSGTTAERSAAGTGKGYLGLTVSSLGATGLRVASVETGGPAEQAGIQPGDLIRSVDSTVVRTPDKLHSIVSARAPGERVSVTYERGDKELQAQVKLGEEPANARIEAAPATRGAPGGNAPAERGGRLGVQVQPITPALKQRYNLTRDTGVVVTDVTADSAAAKAGLQAGDVILAIGGTDVATVAEVQRAVTTATGTSLDLKVLRGDQEMSLKATLTAAALPGLEMLPQQLRDRLQQALNQGALSAQQLQQLQRAYQAGSNNVHLSTLKAVAADSITVKSYSGDEFSIAVDAKTSVRRLGEQIQASDLHANEAVVVLSSDGKTATMVFSFGDSPFPSSFP